MDYGLFTRIEELHMKLDFLIKKLQEAEDKANKKNGIQKKEE